jgi:GT2 family glycosyltransferase
MKRRLETLVSANGGEAANGNPSAANGYGEKATDVRVLVARMVDAPASPDPTRPRPVAHGKFLFLGDQKLSLSGVTYGTFSPRPETGAYPAQSQVRRDFARMAENGINALRTYTVPPRWLLDAAHEEGLLVMVGLPWEQHVTFLDDRSTTRSIEKRVREGVRDCARHPAIAGYAVGNEIPAPIVRWHGARKVERHVRRLYEAAKEEDPEGLVTYVNYPSTEYLRLDFLDFACFNVYLEDRSSLEAYLRRLHNLAGDRPLVIAELGLDSRRNGPETQARTLRWQIEAVSGSGCAGAFVFAWTDEWDRGGFEVDDWDFGLTDRARRAKPALGAVRAAFAAPVACKGRWPRISVVVCAHNGAETLGECLQALSSLEYSNYEVIVVDDGSTDDTSAIAGRYPCQVISTANRGLSSARNTGIHAATGEIVAFIDSDAYPDRHWLQYLATAFTNSNHAGIGGPNLGPPRDELVAQSVAAAPGSPVHVLLSDHEAEHIPGCNCAFRKSALQAVGGFDPQFRTSGDDVDLCWRLQERGDTLGFHPGATVWHHRRGSIRAYLRQQRGYGKAEALLERKWPERYNCAGQLRWSGRMYGPGRSVPLLSGRRRIDHGRWGLGLFQSVYEPAPNAFASLPLMPEWYLLIALLTALSALGALWRPLLGALPVLALAVLTVIAQAVKSSARASLSARPGASRRRRLALRGLTATLFLVQPAARLWGRLSHGLSPWRFRGAKSLKLPRGRSFVAWSETWHGPDERLRAIEAALRDAGAVANRGGNFDRWDLEARFGTLGVVRTRLAIEDHGAGRQLVRMRCWPRCSGPALLATGVLAALSPAAVAGGAPGLGAAFAALAVGLLFRATFELSVATAAVARAFVRASKLQAEISVAPAPRDPVPAPPNDRAVRVSYDPLPAGQNADASP